MEYYFNDGRYIVPLDSLDVSLMSLASTHPDKTDDCKPLWSTDILNMRNEKRYYQIGMQEEVKTVGEVSRGDDSIELKTCICFICNIEVPEQYAGAHVNSYKHEMYLTIAKAAVERINKNMNQKCYTRKTRGSLHFCETCVMVMPVKDRSVHILSDLHKNILKKDMLLQSFVNIYVYDANKVNDVAMLNSGGNEGNTRLGQSDLRDDNLKDVDDNCTTRCALAHETKTSSFDYGNIDYTDAKPAHLVKCIDENHYLIHIEDECGLIVEFDNYHGIDKLTKQRYQCKLCSDTFKRKHRHITTEKHIERISLMIKDKHCIRELDLNQRHCILCNELFDVDDQHVYTEAHEEQIQKAKVNPEEDVDCCKIAEDDLNRASEEVKEERTKFDDNTASSIQQQSDNVSNDNENKYPLSIKACCDLCNVVMDVVSLRAHAHSREHEARKKHNNYMMNEPPDEVCFNCQVCKVPVSLEEIQNHMANSSHRYRYINFLDINNILILDTGEIFCELCKMYMAEGNEIDHVNSKRHEMLKRLKEDQGKTKASQANDIETSKGAVTTELVTQNQISEDKARGISLDESERLSVKLTSKQKNEATEMVDLVETDVSAFESEIKNNTESINREPERTNEEAAPSLIDGTSQINRVNSKLTETKKRRSKPIKKHDKFVFQAVHNKKEMFCNICQSIIPNNERSYKEHINGSKHNDMVARLLKDNHVKKTGDAFHCEICDDHVNPGSQFSHIESKAHKRTLIDVESNLCDIIAVQPNQGQNVEPGNGSRSIKKNEVKSTSTGTDEDKAKDNRIKNFKGSTVSVGANELFCNYCHVVIPKDPASIDEHQASLSHIAKQDLFFKKNEIILIGDDVCRCLLCIEEIKLNMLFRHVQNEFHIASLKMWRTSVGGNQRRSIPDGYILDKCNFVSYNIKENRLTNYTSGFTDEDCKNNCNVTVYTEELNNLVSNRKAMNVIRRNGIVIKDDHCYCRYCHEHFLTKDAMDHATKYKHRAAHRNLNNKFITNNGAIIKNK